ncbi:MAG: hypothetical protein JSW40_07950 [Candidatus Omnitrophota bacterium]|nr:MAG: hypothetical protein JSW40_07950 [Candidatus Omnitrophota bacterium]
MSILLQSFNSFPHSTEKVGLQFRFDSQSPFSIPQDITLARKLGQSFFSYIDLGVVNVNDKRFFLQISFVPPDQRPCIIRHIKFIPLKAHKKKILDGSSQEDLRQRMERLKSLGYL